MPPIYLDHNATTPLDRQVAEAMRACDVEGYLNPASQHQFGQRARRRLELARESIARLLGARTDSHRADQVLFTSGGTEANNLALLGLAGNPPGHVIVTAIEHPSVLGAAEHLERRGFAVDRLPVDEAGVARVADLPGLIRSDTRVVSLMLVNNETGVLQPVREAAMCCQAARVPFHTDAVQGVGKLPVNFAELGATALTATAHKLGGPRGVGVLVLAHGAPLQAIHFGGFQQAGLRPGTESVTLAVGMQTALENVIAQPEVPARLELLRDRFEQALLSQLPDVIVNGGGAARAPHTSNLSFLGVDRQMLVVALDLAGVACSTGSACASGSSDPSHVLAAMGASDPVLRSALRFSFGVSTSVPEVDEACERIVKSINDLRSRKSS
ncbi:MAG: cysteine desulfurase family protein [Planctomycetia bacterium]|nr:cysteine desulfurase family protein [Planctomycetia bacterium]